MSKPLEGVLVVCAEHALAIPLASRHLADLGARVIKLERPGVGDFARSYDEQARGLSSHFVWGNRGKESIEVDLRDEGDAALVRRMVARADVFVQNFAPGAIDRLGFGAEAMRALNPRLIYCSMSGYGRGGPAAQRKAYDLLIQAETGVLDITGTETERVKTGLPVADIAGSQNALSSVLAALYQRERTGQGVTLEVNLFDSLIEWMGYPINYAMSDHIGPPRTGARHAAIYPYGPFPVADGEQIYFAIQNEREWLSFCTVVLGRPELAEHPDYASNSRRLEARESLGVIIDEALSQLPLPRVRELLEQARIANADMRSIAQVWEHPELTARSRWREVGSSVGPLPITLPPYSFDGVVPAPGDIPALGQHNDAIRKEFSATEGQR